MRFLFVGSSLVIFAHTTHSRKYGFATEIEKLLEKQVEDQATKRIFFLTNSCVRQPLHGKRNIRNLQRRMKPRNPENSIESNRIVGF